MQDREAKSVLSPDRSDHGLDRRQQVVHRDLAGTALLVEAVLPSHVGVRCFGGGIKNKRDYIHAFQIITVVVINTSYCATLNPFHTVLDGEMSHSRVNEGSLGHLWG